MNGLGSRTFNDNGCFKSTNVFSKLYEDSKSGTGLIHFYFLIPGNHCILQKYLAHETIQVMKDMLLEEAQSSRIGVPGITKGISGKISLDSW